MHLIVHREMPEDRRRGMLTKVLGQKRPRVDPGLGFRC